MAVGDAYGAEQWREADGDDELAKRTETIRRSDCRAVAEYAFRDAQPHRRARLRRAEVDRQPGLRGDAEGGDGRRRRAPPRGRLRAGADRRDLAGLVTGAATEPLVIPCLNRDGDLLSDLVLPLFGSIAGAESVLLALDDELRPSVAMAEAPHGTAPALEGKDLANPMAMILAGAALLHYAAERGRPTAAETASRAIYEAVLETVAAGIRTPDLGGHAGTTEFTDAVIELIAASSRSGQPWRERLSDLPSPARG